MSELKRNLPKSLRNRIREFEDRKISAAELAREVQFVAREIHTDHDSGLRRSLERLGNQIHVLAERGLSISVHSEVLNVVDELVNELVDSGY